MILFLDFDGVLHPFPMTPSNKHFSAVPMLWKVMDRIPQLSVVITSTWREQFSIAQLVELLTDHGGERFAARFIGVTPIIENDNDYVVGIRQREIESWLIENGNEEETYLILDDIEGYFDATCANLYLVDGVTGLTECDAEMIPVWLGL